MKRLFKAIEKHGYKWNDETKTLDKLIIPKFKVGDIIVHKIHRHEPFLITEITEQSYKGTQHEILLEQQDNFELAPNYLTKNNLQESFNEVINQAEERGYLEITDVRKLANSGIPLLSFCTDRSVFFDAIRYRFEKWLNSL